MVTSVSFGSAIPPHIPEKTGVSGHPAIHPPVQENLLKPAIPVAAKDPAQVPERVAGDVPASLVTEETEVRKQLVRSEVRSEPLDCSTAAANLDPDRWCWPNSGAISTAEIAIFEARFHLFGARGVDLKEAEVMADRLVLRDRDADERRLCFECQHLQVQPANHWRAYAELRCGNWLAAGLCVFARDAELSQAFARQLQRCSGFEAVTS
jgi:hypothetical protein